MARRLLLMALALASSGAVAQTRAPQELQTVGAPGPVDNKTQTEDVHFRSD